MLLSIYTKAILRPSVILSRVWFVSAPERIEEWRVTGRLYTAIHIFEGVPPFCELTIELLYTQKIQDPLSHMRTQ